MKREEQIGNDALEVNAPEFIAKNLWVPKEVGFDSCFFLKVITGRKKYIPANFTLKSKLKYFRHISFK